MPRMRHGMLREGQLLGHNSSETESRRVDQDAPLQQQMKPHVRSHWQTVMQTQVEHHTKSL